MEIIKNSELFTILSNRLPTWYAQNARSLPWRENREPYRVWISEIMLQQTRVEAVRGYYTRFLQKFPTVEALAEADEDTVLKLWEGLGYYSRARNLQRAAQVIVRDCGGVFPREYAAIRALPGIGDYTAGAIASICFDQPTPAVDGNVLRVAARVCDLDVPTDRPEVKRAITDALAAVYPATDCGIFTQALMELGATVCTPRAVRCDACPMRDVCCAYAAGTVEKRPVRSEKRAKREEERTVFLFTCGDRIAIEKRPKRGLLAGLWQFPNISGTLTLDESLAVAKESGLAPVAPIWEKQRTHIFTHIVWRMHGVAIECRECAGDFAWATRGELAETYSLPTAFRQFLEE